jgi:hypothetical protein
MAVAAKAKAARTVTRDEPEARMPDRTPERDPNKIYTRDGRVVDLERIKRQSDDRFDLKALGVFAPAGWVYEWRTRKIKNADWTKAHVDDAEAGWTPVPANRHPGKIMPMGFEGAIEQEGMMLMERDARLTAMSRRMQSKEANEQLNVSRSMSGLLQRAAPNSGAITDFDHGAARNATGVGIERIPMGDPTKNYNYTLDE